MTAKRFVIDKKGGVFYLFDNGNLIPISDGQPICDLLNELSEENEQLEQELDYWKKKALFSERKEMCKQYNEIIR